MGRLYVFHCLKNLILGGGEFKQGKGKRNGGNGAFTNQVETFHFR
jgi:hypothetical protein